MLQTILLCRRYLGGAYMGMGLFPSGIHFDHGHYQCEIKQFLFTQRLLDIKFILNIHILKTRFTIKTAFLWTTSTSFTNFKGISFSNAYCFNVSSVLCMYFNYFKIFDSCNGNMNLFLVHKIDVCCRFLNLTPK